MTDQITFASVCSGIEAASVALEKYQWKPLVLSEIEPFPRAVLTHRYPGVRLVGDFTKMIDDPPDVDVLIGGTPCQDYSMAGLRAGLEGERGNLTLQFIRLANAIDDLRRDRGKHPCIFVWENVPGVFTIKDNGFGAILGDMVGEDAPIVPYGGRWTDAGLVIGPRRRTAWTVKDSQYFRLAQRRRRVFIVGSAAEGFDPSTVLFESEGVRRHSPPRRESRQGAATPTEGSAGSGGEPGLIADVAPTLPSRTSGGGGLGTDHDLDGGLIANALTAADGRRLARRDGDNLIPEVSAALAGGTGGGVGHQYRQKGNEDQLVVVPTLEATAGRSRGAGTPTSMIVPIIDRDVVSPLLAQGNSTGGDRPPGSTVDTTDHLVIMSSGQANAEIMTDGRAPALTCLHEAPIIAQAFKPSHFTRGKDGAPGEVVPPLSADADKGDQDTVVCVPIQNATRGQDQNGLGVGGEVMFTLDQASQHAVAFSIMPMNSGKDFKARPTDVAQPLMATGPVKGAQGGDYVVFNARQDPITYGETSGPLDTDANTMAIAFSAKDSGQDASEEVAPTMRAMHETNGNANGGGQVAVAFQSRIARNGRGGPSDVVPALSAQSGETGKGDAAPLVAIPFDTTQLTSKVNRSNPQNGDPCHTLAAGANPPSLTNGWEVRRLTPTECERLQGFPDGWTDVPYRKKPAADGPRYKTLGNAMSVPVILWIGGRLQTSLAWLKANPPKTKKGTKS